MFAFPHWRERIFVRTHNIENRFVIGPENVPFCRLVQALFSPEILQAVAVKGLMGPISSTKCMKFTKL